MTAGTTTPLLVTLEEPRTAIWETAAKDWHMYLLLDSACAPDAVAKLFLFEQYRRHIPLFAGTFLETAMDVTPWLTELPPSSELVEWLLTDAPKGWGMLLFTGESEEAIVRHFRSLMKVTAETGGHLTFRPWDGRILERIADHLPEDIPRLLGPVRHAIVIHEGGEWVAIDNPTPLAAEQLEKYYQVPAWYVFDEVRSTLFDDKRLLCIARNVAESLYEEEETYTVTLPEGKDIFTFVLDGVWQGRGLGLREEESLRHFVYCLFHLGTNFPDERTVKELQAGVANEEMIRHRLHTLWTEAKSHG